MRVLVVDDEAAIRFLVESIFSDEGDTVFAANDGVAAMALLERIPDPDVIILDLNMPRMGGRDFFHALRESGRTTAVVIVSAVGARKAASELGAEASVEKPFDLRTLVNIVHEAAVTA